MNRAFPVLVAILLILCSPAAAFEAGMPSSATTTPSARNPIQPPGFNNTTYQLSLETADRSDTYTPTLSLGTALEMDRGKLESQKRMNTLDAKLSKAKSNGVKRQMLYRFRGNLRTRLSGLETQERTTSQKFDSQEIDTAEYIKDIAILRTKAKNVERSVDHMSAEAEKDGVLKFSPNDGEFQASLISLEGRVRKSAVINFHYGTNPKPIYVATTKKGVVLSTISNNQYIREAYRDDYRNASKGGEITLKEANNITGNQYPWTAGKRSPSTRLIYNHVSRTKIIHPQGLITAYLDGGTKKIFREIQYKYLTGENHVPYGDPIRNNSTNLNLVVNRTYAGGPLRINLTDGNGEPVDGRIQVGDKTLGNTGKEGTIFTVSPSRQFTVTARHDDETLKVTLTPYGVTNGSSEGGTPVGAGQSSEG